MSGQHAPVAADDCPQCRKGFAFLHAWHQDHPDMPPTGAQVADAMGLRPRMALVHLAHLARSGKLCEDRRTPAPGATVGRELPPVSPDQVSPLDWAANEGTPDDCRTCAALLRVLAAESRGTWRGQISAEELAKRTAKALGKGAVSTRTVRMHLRSGHRQQLGHSLVGAGLVAFERPDAEIIGKDQYGRVMYRRRPDRFILWPSQVHKSEPAQWKPYTAEGAAARLLRETVWFDPTRPQAGWVVRLVAGLLERDCPDAEIRAQLMVTPRTAAPLASQYRFARRRLAPLLEHQGGWVRPMPETVADPAARPSVTVNGDGRKECQRCGKPAVWRGRPHVCTEPEPNGPAIVPPTQRTAAQRPLAALRSA